jgi:hypothetical protein
MKFIKDRKYKVIETNHDDYKINDIIIYNYPIGKFDEDTHIVTKNNEHYVLIPKLVKVQEIK